MVRIAVIGANGQVGAELCLLLAQVPHVAVVPVCRTRSGSAFLRSHGLAVRHGSCGDAENARRLLGDCDVVVNSALATGTPAQIRASEDAIINCAMSASPPDASVIHFSTQSVYGDPTPGKLIRWRNPYGRAKLSTERTGLNTARRIRKKLFVLRLGHVGGALQRISEEMRVSLAEGTALLPERDVPSNIVYTVTILDAILKIAHGSVAPGVYDLMNVPQMSWRAVYEEERRIGGLPSTPIRVARAGMSPTPLGWIRQWPRRIARLVGSVWIRHFSAKILARAPGRLNERAQAWWHCQRARSEIAALKRTEVPIEHLSWVTNGSVFIGSLVATAELLRRNPYSELLRSQRTPWPEDLPDAGDRLPSGSPLGSTDPRVDSVPECRSSAGWHV